MPKESNYLPAWVQHGLIKHGASILIVIAVGSIAWTQIQNDVVKAADLAKDNKEAISGVKREVKKVEDKVNQIDRKQGIIIEQIDNVKREAARERDAQTERHGETQKSLDRILNLLNRRAPPR